LEGGIVDVAAGDSVAVGGSSTGDAVTVGVTSAGDCVTPAGSAVDVGSLLHDVRSKMISSKLLVRDKSRLWFTFSSLT
jgi:hypothetical protein